MPMSTFSGACHEGKCSDLPSRYTTVVREVLRAPFRPKIKSMKREELTVETRIAHMLGWQEPT